MEEGLFCSECGFEEDELYEYEYKELCFYCLSKIANIKTQTIKQYYVNGEWFSEDEFFEMMEALDCTIIN